MMRTLIRQSLIASTELETLGVVPEAVMAGDVDTPEYRPFLNLRWNTTTPGLATVDRRSLVIWVHDEPGDYDRIDRIIREIKAIMTSLVGVAHAYGYLVVAEWSGDSEDLTDPGHGTITRTTTYSLVGTGQ